MMNLHAYQEESVQFAIDKKRVLLTNGLGTGKTLIGGTVIQRLVAEKEVKRVLIASTKRLIEYTWPQEFTKWPHLRGLHYTILNGTPKQRVKKMEEDLITMENGYSIHLINFELIPWLIKKEGFQYDLVIFDESSKLKSPSSKRFKALRRVIHRVPRVICMTATPCSNSLLDIWSQIYLVDPTGFTLGKTFTHFREVLFSPDYWGHTWKPKPGTEEAIHKRIKGVTLTMRTEDYNELPPRTDIIDQVTLPQPLVKEYESLKKEMYLQLLGGEVEALNPAVLVGKCQQFASGALYLESQKFEEIHTEKFEALKDLIESADGPVIVAYQYISELERLKKWFPQGKSIGKDGRGMEEWNTGKLPILFLHPASSGHGLNLQGPCNRLIWLSLPWSLENYIQTNGRIHRQGQDRPVFIHHILCRGTVDHDILVALKNKRTIQEQLLLATSKKEVA